MLTLMSKNPVKFVVSDQLAETAVVLSSDDDEETLKDKLRRVLELAGGLPPVRVPLGPVQLLPGLAAPAPDPVVLAADRAATEARLAQASSVMGWSEDADLDNLPEV